MNDYTKGSTVDTTTEDTSLEAYRSCKRNGGDVKIAQRILDILWASEFPLTHNEIYVRTDHPNGEGQYGRRMTALVAHGLIVEAGVRHCTAGTGRRAMTYRAITNVLPKPFRMIPTKRPPQEVLKRAASAMESYQDPDVARVRDWIKNSLIRKTE